MPQPGPGRPAAVSHAGLAQPDAPLSRVRCSMCFGARSVICDDGFGARETLTRVFDCAEPLTRDDARLRRMLHRLCCATFNLADAS